MVPPALLLLLPVLLAAPPATPPCGPAPATVPERLAHYSALAPVFLGGVVVRGRGNPKVVDAALASAGIASSRTMACPGGGFLAWLPGVSGEVSRLLTRPGVTMDEVVVFRAAEGQAWLLEECAEATRCEQLTALAHAEGLCGFTLEALGVPVSSVSLGRCRALAPSDVTCALGARPAGRKCRRHFLEAVGAP